MDYKGLTIHVTAAEQLMSDSAITAQLGGTPTQGDRFIGCNFIGASSATAPINLVANVSNLSFIGCQFRGAGIRLMGGLSGYTFSACSFFNCIGGSNAFAIFLAGTTDSTFENLSFFGCERPVLFWNGSQGHGSSHNLTFRDIVIDGAQNVSNSGESILVHGTTLTALNLHATTQATRTNNLATYTIKAGEEWTNKLYVNDEVIVSGCADPSFNGRFTVTSVVRSSSTFTVSQTGPNASTSTSGATALPLYKVRGCTFERIRIIGPNTCFATTNVLIENCTWNNMWMQDGAMFIFFTDDGSQPYLDHRNLTINNSEFNGPVLIWCRNRANAFSNVVFNNPWFVRSRSRASEGNPFNFSIYVSTTPPYPQPSGLPAFFTALYAPDAGGADFARGLHRDTATPLSGITLVNPRWYDFEHGFVPRNGPSGAVWTEGRPMGVRGWPPNVLRKGGTISGSERRLFVDIFGVGEDQSSQV